MIVTGLIFYLFAAITVASGVMVVTARNPVHSVLFLILAFFNAAGLFLLAGAEFLALILVIVYVGAVAVLFLFVVMMLDVDFRQLRQGAKAYLPIGALVGLVLLVELVVVFGAWQVAAEAPVALAARTTDVAGATNTHALGMLMYTQYFYLFQVCGLILLVAMIGAIVLTLRGREGVRRQDIGDQLARTPRDAVAIRKVPTGEGV